MEKETKKEEEKPEPKPAGRKRKAVPDPELSTPRPRRLEYEGDASEDEHEGSEGPHVPTPTSSAYGDSDDEDKDLFKDKYRVQSSGSKPQETKKAIMIETPPTKKASTPASNPSCSRVSSCTEEVQDMLAGVEDELLATIPTSLSRLADASTPLIYCFSFSPRAVSQDFRYVLNILQVEDIVTYKDALENFGVPDCFSAIFQHGVE